MRDPNAYAVGLLTDPRNSQIYPLSTLGFERGQGALRGIRTRAPGNFFFDIDTSVSRIAEVRYVDSGPLRSLLRATELGGGRLTVLLEKEPMALGTLKELILGSLAAQAATADPDDPWPLVADGMEVSTARIRGAESFCAHFEPLRLPAAEDCLDSL